MITKMYISSIVLLALVLIKSSCQIYNNTEKQLSIEETLIDTPISFGIKSFTIEITKPTTKPLNLHKTNEMISSTKNHSLDKVEIINKISNNNSSGKISDSTQNIELTNIRNNKHGNVLNQSIIKLENTGEQPPSAKSFGESLTNIKSITNNLYPIKIMSLVTESSTLNSQTNIEFSDIQKNDTVQHSETKLNDFNVSENNKKFFEKLHQNKTTNNKMNIIDLYPSEVKDFVPTTIKINKNLKINDDNNEHTNSLNELFNINENVSRSKIDIELIDETNNNKNVNKEFSETDLTGKLQERDGIITEIETKFRLDDLLQITEKPIQIMDKKKFDIIDRRVKKSFTNLPNKKTDKDITTERVDIGNTKFNTNVKDQIDKNSDSSIPYEGREDLSTTKFYNSKELYNEMLKRKNNKLLIFSKVETNEKPNLLASSQIPIFTTTESISKSYNTQTNNNLNSISTQSTTIFTPTTKNVLQKNEIFIKNATPIPISSSSVQTSSTYGSSTDEFSEKTESINTESTSNLETISYSAVSHDTTRALENSEHLIVTSSVAGTTILPNVNLLQQEIGSTILIPKPSMPSFRSHILTRLQQKINALECDIQNVSPDSKIWRGNETHELLLPVTAIENCTQPQNCKTKIKTWEGQTEIQSGDVLLVEINDSLLGQDDHANIVHKPTTQVYQVTRPGYEHCDVTEGVLLDITPLVVDEKKLVTLYDKDLTEGINLLIVVSELWGNQCVRLKVTVKSDNCGENADCSTKGVCFSNESMEGYECQCCSGFAGSHCEEIDACSPSPCTNNGICVDLSQGHEGNAYQCLCPYGYTGKNCQYESDPCNPAECLNGATCTGNSTHFGCHCAPGYTGPLCQHNLNECESSPCVHGICVDQENGFRCFCQPGFSGELCNFEYNECESNPCLNEAQCVDQIGGFDCKCTKGYTGSRCQIKVDFCANKPCPEEHRCIDHGNYFSCECPRGRNGPDCNQIPRIQCSVNTCANGGTCWSRSDSFYCACRPGYTGKLCEDEFVVETVVSSSEFMVDDTRNFNEKPFGANPIKSPVELHNAYIAAGTLAAAIFIVAIVVTVCHCKVNQTYRRFSNRQTAFIPIFGFGKRVKSPKSHRHWLSGKRILGNNGANTQYQNPYTGGNGQLHQQISHPVNERSFHRQLALNLENDMYYTVDFSESQNSPLMQ